MRRNDSNTSQSDDLDSFADGLVSQGSNCYLLLFVCASVCTYVFVFVRKLVCFWVPELVCNLFVFAFVSWFVICLFLRS